MKFINDIRLGNGARTVTAVLVCDETQLGIDPTNSMRVDSNARGINNWKLKPFIV